MRLQAANLPHMVVHVITLSAVAVHAAEKGRSNLPSSLLLHETKAARCKNTTNWRTEYLKPRVHVMFAVAVPRPDPHNLLRPLNQHQQGATHGCLPQSLEEDAHSATARPAPPQALPPSRHPSPKHTAQNFHRVATTLDGSGLRKAAGPSHPSPAGAEGSEAEGGRDGALERCRAGGEGAGEPKGSML